MRMRVAPEAPTGFVYVPDFLSLDEEAAIAAEVTALELERFAWHGHEARRSVIAFGHGYSFESGAIEPAPPLPAWLVALAERAARVAAPATPFVQAVVTRYPPGAGIGWHRDVPAFGGVVAGVSLGSACRLDLRRGPPGDREVFRAMIAPRSLYVLGGCARAAWQHGIEGTPGWRTSITFRTLRRPRARRGSRLAA
jgi:alkylated DNA repair dioxygenase AlkB